MIEDRIREVIEAAGIEEPDASRYLRDALNFGPALDLDDFARRLEGLRAPDNTDLAV